MKNVTRKIFRFKYEPCLGTCYFGGYLMFLGEGAEAEHSINASKLWNAHERQ